MNTKLNLFSKYIFVFIGALVIAFLIHIGILRAMKLPMFDNLLVESYILNFALATLICFILFRFRIKMKNQLGFLFMAGSFLKFSLFFIFFQPKFKADGDIGTLEFSSFFIPYLLCLLIETFFIAKLLKSIEEETKN